ncbi:hypothetical protein F5X99DRAFT_376958 [Biscogniauxia marginata]|nr:hypothetical protein F5X99DRAFT_376958 [Biscogniauxia marginata]
MPQPSADNLTQEQETLALQKIKDSNIRQVSTAQYVQDVKQSMLFRPGFNWNELLSAAPVSVSLLASLFVASTIPDATQIKIIPPHGGFKYLSNFDSPALNTCLIQCADQGAKAFGTSAKSFDAISLKSSTIKQTINQIIGLLGDPDSAQTLLAPSIKTLARVAKDCESKARDMESVFQAWLDMVCELHMCVVQTSSDASEKRAANQIQYAAAKTKLESAAEAKKLATESTTTLKSSLETATSAYKKAADEFPSGWDLVAQQFVGNLTDTFTNALNLAVPALIENFSITAKIEKGVNIFKPGNGGAQGGSVGDGKADHSNVPTTTNAPPVTPSATPPFPNDPAYGVIGHIRGHVLTIRSYVTGGADEGVDWDLLQSKDPEKQNMGIGVLAVLLDDASKSFKGSNNPPSQTLVDVLAKVKKVTDGLQKSIADNKSINGTPLPKADSTEVKEWQLTMNTQAAKAVQLDTDSKNLSNATAPPMVNPPQVNSSPTDKNGAFRKQIIDAATTKLDQTAKVMQTVTENYQKASDKFIEVQLKIGEIQAELATLQAANINLDKIKAILIKCIDILVQLKSQINRLVAFFSAISTLVDHVVADQVEPFIEYLSASTHIDKPERSILNFSFTDFQRQMIFSFSLNVRAYFELFRDIADMYLDVDRQFIRPGLEMVNNMQTEYNNTSDTREQQRILENRTKMVADFNKNATQGVKDLVEQKQATIVDNLETKATTAAAQLEFVPVKPPAIVTKAITASNDTAKQAAAQGIDESGKYLTRKFTDTSSLIDDS